jgi:hypothetical protein
MRDGPVAGSFRIQDMGNRAARRRGSNPAFGTSNADEHADELVGSSRLWIYLPPNKRLKGYDELKRRVEASGCTMGLADDAPIDPGNGYHALQIAAAQGTVLPGEVLKQAHRWAHRHNFLHSFFKPPFSGLFGAR